MIKNYLKIASAILIKNKIYSLISIASLTIGISVSILLLIYVLDELSYDRYHDKADNIYRLCQEEHPYQAPQMASYLADHLPEIKNYVRILPREDITFQYKENKFKEDVIAFVDAELFQIFSFKFKSGNVNNALKQPFTIVITEHAAHKYFGDEDPLGKVFKLNDDVDFTITGVIENIPKNSHFRYDFFLTLTDSHTLFGKEMMSNWGWQNFLVYFQIQDTFSKSDLESKINNAIKNSTYPDKLISNFTIQNLKDIHLFSSHIENDIQPQNSIVYVMIFSTIGLLILLIACFNYINLLTANATTRLIEIGVRKSFGASKKQLAIQFISESIIILILSLGLSLLVVRMGLPIFNELSGKELSFTSLINLNIILGILCMTLIVGILAGGYPALFLSSYNPIKVLKTSNKSGNLKIQFKKIIVGVQFTIVIVLISCAIVMLRQIKFLQQKDLGFNKEAILISDVDFGNETKYNTLKQMLLDQAYVSSISSASRIPSGSLSNIGLVLPEDKSKWIEIPYVHVNFDYFKTLGISAAEGRLFSEQLKTDSTEAIILNKAALKSLEIEGDPIGQTLRCNWPKSNRKIVGIINDINFESLYDKIKPTVFVIHPDQCHQLIIKITEANNINTINTITQICQNVYPEQVFDFHFLDDKLEQAYQKDNKTFHLMGYFSALAIILSCLGLLGLASYILARRIKEIGIRKANGAKTYEIIAMLNKNFAKWVFIAFVIACPISWYAMNQWLQNFAYKTDLSWWIFALSGLLVMGIALLTVSWQSWRAAKRNPVESLRYE